MLCFENSRPSAARIRRPQARNIPDEVCKCASGSCMSHRLCRCADLHRTRNVVGLLSLAHVRQCNGYTFDGPERFADHTRVTWNGSSSWQGVQVLACHIACCCADLQLICNVVGVLSLARIRQCNVSTCDEPRRFGGRTCITVNGSSSYQGVQMSNLNRAINPRSLPVRTSVYFCSVEKKS